MFFEGETHRDPETWGERHVTEGRDGQDTEVLGVAGAAETPGEDSRISVGSSESHPRPLERQVR